MTDDIEEAPEPAAGDLAKIANLAKRLRELSAEAVALTEALAAKSKAIREIQETDLPRIMLDLGLADFNLIGGGHIELKTEHYGSITKDRAPRCHTWLRDNGHASIIKRELKAAFGKDGDDMANKLAAVIKALGSKVKFSDKESVHGGTLKAFINEQIRQGHFSEGSEEAQLFNLFTRRFAEVEFPDGVFGHNGGPPLDDGEEF